MQKQSAVIQIHTRPGKCMCSKPRSFWCGWPEKWFVLNSNDIITHFCRCTGIKVMRFYEAAGYRSCQNLAKLSKL